MCKFTPLPPGRRSSPTWPRRSAVLCSTRATTAIALSMPASTFPCGTVLPSSWAPPVPVTLCPRSVSPGPIGFPSGGQPPGPGPTAAADGGLLISTRRACAVEVDPVSRTARLQAGTTWAQVIEAAAPFGLAPLAGAAPSVGAVSYTLGGGRGPWGRRYGFAADHVRAIEVVTADGELRRVTPGTYPDLFWAMRGAGSNFGVVTSLEIDLMTVPDLYGGGLFFPGEARSSVLTASPPCALGPPDTLSLSAAVLPSPALPVPPRELRGRHCCHVRV